MGHPSPGGTSRATLRRQRRSHCSWLLCRLVELICWKRSTDPMTERSRPPGLIQRYREELQARHYAPRTVDTYEQWLRRFLRFHKRRHPLEMGSEEVNAFLTHLAVKGQVSAGGGDCSTGVGYACSQGLPRSGWRRCD